MSRNIPIVIFLIFVIAFFAIAAENPAVDEPDKTFDIHYPPAPIPVVVENQDGPCDDCGCFLQSTF